MRLAAILLLALAAPALAGEPRTFKALNLTGAAATAFKFADGDTFEACNLQQPVAHTPIGGAARGLVFTRCNLMNCDLPKDATPKQCLSVHYRTVVVETQTAAVVAELTSAEDKAVAAAVADIEREIKTIAETDTDRQIAELRAKQAVLANDAIRAVLVSRTTAKQWVPPEGLVPVPVVDAKGQTTAIRYTRQEVIP